MEISFFGYLWFGLPLKDISFLLLNFLLKLFYTFFPSIFQVVQQPLVEWIFLHIHRLFKHQGEILSFLCLHGCFHDFFADFIVNGDFYFAYLWLGLRLKDISFLLLSFLF